MHTMDRHAMDSQVTRTVAPTDPLRDRHRWASFMTEAAVWWLGVTASGRGRIEIEAPTEWLR